MFVSQLQKGETQTEKGGSGDQSPNLLRNEGSSRCETFVAKIKTVLNTSGIHFLAVNFHLNLET